MLTLAMGVTLTGCDVNDLTKPEYNIPTVETGSVENVSTRTALIRIVSTVNSSSYILASTHADFSDSIFFNNPSTKKGDYWYLTNLQPSTTYYYKQCATDGLTTVYGEVKQFTTSTAVAVNSVKLADWDEKNATDYQAISIGITYADTATTNYWSSATINQEITYNEKMNTWKMPNDIAPMESKTARLFAYAPYNSNMSSSTEYNTTAACYKYNEDLLYGSSDIVNTDNPKGNIVLHHKMARIIFSFTKTYDSNVDDAFNNLYLTTKNDIIPSTCSMNIVTGTTYITSRYSTIARGTDEFKLDSITAKNIIVDMIPWKFSDNMVELSIQGNYSDIKSASYLTSAEWKEGYQYTYPVKVSRHQLVIGDVQVTPWVNNDAGNINIKK